MKIHKICGTYRKGMSIGDFATEWWTEEDWKRQRKNIEELKRTGEYGKEESYCIELVHNPELDGKHILNDLIERKTAQFIIFDTNA